MQMYSETDSVLKCSARSVSRLKQGLSKGSDMLYSSCWELLWCKGPHVVHSIVFMYTPAIGFRHGLWLSFLCGCVRDAVDSDSSVETLSELYMRTS